MNRWQTLADYNDRYEIRAHICLQAKATTGDIQADKSDGNVSKPSVWHM